MCPSVLSFKTSRQQPAVNQAVAVGCMPRNRRRPALMELTHQCGQQVAEATGGKAWCAEEQKGGRCELPDPSLQLRPLL